MLHGRSNHIYTKCHFLRNKVQDSLLEVVHVSTHKQLADVLTKAIKTKDFINLRDGIGVVHFKIGCELKDGVECNSTFKIDLVLSFTCI